MLAVIACAVLLLGMLVPSFGTDRSRTGKVRRIGCVNNLKNIGLAYRIYASDNGEKYPWYGPATNRPVPMPSNYAVMPGTPLAPGQGVATYFAVVSNELSTLKILICSSDTNRFALTTNSFAFLMAPAQTPIRDRAVSYFLGTSAGEDNPQSILSGDRNLAGPPFGADASTPPSQVALRIPPSVANSRASWKSAGWTKDIHSSVGNLLLGDGSVPQVSSRGMRQQFRTAALASTNDLDLLWPAN